MFCLGIGCLVREPQKKMKFQKRVGFQNRAWLRLQITSATDIRLKWRKNYDGTFPKVFSPVLFSPLSVLSVGFPFSCTSVRCYLSTHLYSFSIFLLFKYFFPNLKRIAKKKEQCYRLFIHSLHYLFLYFLYCF